MTPAGYDIMVGGLPVAVALVHKPSPHTYAALGAHRARYAEKRRVLREIETEEKLDEAIDDLDAMSIDRPNKRSRRTSTYDEEDKENAETTARHDAMYERLVDSARWSATPYSYSYDRDRGSQYTYTRASSPVSDRTSSPPPFDCGHLVAARWDSPSSSEDDILDDASNGDEESSDEDEVYQPYREYYYHPATMQFIPPQVPSPSSVDAQAQSSSASNVDAAMKPNQFSWAPIEVETQRVADRLEMTHLAGRFAAEFEREIDEANAFWRGSASA